MSTPDDRREERQWDEGPRGAVSRSARLLGWLLVVAWMAATGGFALWELARSPEGLFPKLLVFGAVAGLLLLFVSALVDRLRVAGSDPYREVRK